jgi:hypothetical protein
MVMASMMALQTEAAATEPRDTVYFYDSWRQMLDMEPVSMLVSPIIELETPYAIDIYTTTSDYRLYDHMAATLGDSIWLMSNVYLMNNFKGDSKQFKGYKFIPVFFNEKVAFLTYVGIGDNLSVKDILFGDTRDYDDYSSVMDYYYIDFMKHEVRKVTPEVLSELLEDYHDLQMRYEGMRDYKKRYIIEDYFLKYVDRATQDIMRPYILDLVAK